MSQLTGLKHPWFGILWATAGLVLAAVWIVVVGIIGALMLVFGLVDLKNGQPDFSTFQLGTLTWMQFGAMFLIVALLTWVSKTPWRTSFALNNPGTMPIAAAVIGGLTVWMFPSKLAEWIAANFPGISLGALDQIGIALSSGTALERIFFCSAVVLGAPLFEELLFRGFLFHQLQRTLPAWVVWLLTSFFFAAFHLDPAHALPVLFTGLFLGALRWASGSIYPSILAHFLNNGLAAVMVYWGGSDTTENTPLPLGAAAIGIFMTLGAAFIAAAGRLPPVPEVDESDDATEPPRLGETPIP